MKDTIVTLSRSMSLIYFDSRAGRHVILHTACPIVHCICLVLASCTMSSTFVSFFFASFFSRPVPNLGPPLPTWCRRRSSLCYLLLLPLLMIPSVFDNMSALTISFHSLLISGARAQSHHSSMKMFRSDRAWDEQRFVVIDIHGSQRNTPPKGRRRKLVSSHQTSLQLFAIPTFQFLINLPHLRRMTSDLSRPLLGRVRPKKKKDRLQILKIHRDMK